MNRAPFAAAIASSASACRPLPTTIEASESRTTYSSSAGGCEVAKWNGDAAGQPDAARGDDVRERGRDEKGHARLGEIARRRARARPPRAPPRPRVVVGEHAVSGDDGKAVGSDDAIVAASRSAVQLSRVDKRLMVI
jgi:hypothetical protein